MSIKKVIPWQKSGFLIFLAINSAANFSFISTHPYDSILSQDDRELEQVDSKSGPALKD